MPRTDRQRRFARYLLALGLSALLPVAGRGQKLPDIVGTWRVDAGADTKNGPREAIIRADSSASWGKETVRWRLKGDTIWIVLGGEWESHRIKVKDNVMTLFDDPTSRSDSRLDKPVMLKRVGPATPRPPGVKIPDDPDH